MPRLYRLRWRLAQRLAPAPIMRDPYPGDGAFVTMRKGSTTASFKFERAKFKSSHRLPSFDTEGFAAYHRSGSRTTFVGISGR